MEDSKNNSLGPVEALLDTEYGKKSFNNDDAKNILKNYMKNLYENNVNENEEETIKKNVVADIKKAIAKAIAKAAEAAKTAEATAAANEAKVADDAKVAAEAVAKEAVADAQQEQQGGSDPASNNNDNIKNMVDLLSADTKIVKEIEILSKLTDPGNKKILESLKTNLLTHQETILNRSKNGDQFPTKLLKLINSKIETLNNIAKEQQGGSISTNNSIRRKIFTDLKYITKYLKYKTKYMILKSKY